MMSGCAWTTRTKKTTSTAVITPEKKVEDGARSRDRPDQRWLTTKRSPSNISLPRFANPLSCAGGTSSFLRMLFT